MHHEAKQRQTVQDFAVAVRTARFMRSSPLLDRLGDMSTIINNPRAEPERAVFVEGGDNSAGWAVAVVILLAVVVGGAYWYVHYHRAGAAPSGNTNINVTLPAAPSAGATGQ